MDTVRIGFFLEELYGISCCPCDIENAFLYGKTKEKVYLTAGLEFGATLNGKNLIIDKSLCMDLRLLLLDFMNIQVSHF
jgi:hypothetical protein